MSVTAPLGFRAAGVTAGLKASGDRDVAVVINDGPSRAAAAVFTTNRVQAAPVKWSRQVVSGGRVAAVVLNSGGANACTGPLGFQDTHATAERLAAALDDSAGRDRGLLDRPDRRAAADGQAAARRGRGRRRGRQERRRARRRRDPHHRHRRQDRLHGGQDGYAIGGMAKGAGMLAPALATMLVVLTTDADLTPAELDAALRSATAVTFDRLDSDGCMSTNDTVLLMASGASGVKPGHQDFTRALTEVCADLARQLQRTRRARRSTSRSRSSARRARRTRSPSAAAWRGTTCSSARSRAPTPTGAGCSPRSAPPTRSSTPTGSTSR